jgi:hypothetical protein
MPIRQYVADLLRHRDELLEAVRADQAASADERGKAVNLAIAGCRDVDKMYGPAFREAQNLGTVPATMLRQLRRVFDHLPEAAGRCSIHGEALLDVPAVWEFNSLAAELLDVLPTALLPVLTAALIAGPTAARAPGVTVDGAVRHQTIDGFGTCLMARVTIGFTKKTAEQFFTALERAGGG